LPEVDIVVEPDLEQAVRKADVLIRATLARARRLQREIDALDSLVVKDPAR
jgi:hypothetical protein